jgi:hypothetical protein
MIGWKCIFALMLSCSPAFALEADIRARSDGNAMPVIIGVTNLPDETKLLIGLRRNQANYFAQANVAVQNGQFRTERFSAFGKPLPTGDYELEVSMGIAGMQSAKVQAVIGANGERLTGPLVEKTKFGTVLKSRSKINIGGKGSPEADAASRRESGLALDKWRHESCEWIKKVSQSAKPISECIAELSKQ